MSSSPAAAAAAAAAGGQHGGGQRAFYFNARDGWRVGDLLGASSAPRHPASTVASSLVIPILDACTGLRETIQYHDLMTTNDETNAKALEKLTHFRDMFAGKVSHQRAIPNGDAATAFDLCEYRPSPLSFLPSTIDALRVLYERYVEARVEGEGVQAEDLSEFPCRVAAGGPLQIAMKPAPSSGNALEGAPKAGALSAKTLPPSSRPPAKLPSSALTGAAAAAALCATNSSQSIFCMGAQSTLADAVQHAVAACGRFRAAEVQIGNLLLAANILSMLVHDGHAQQHGVVSIALQTAPAPDGSSSSGADKSKPGKGASADTVVLRGIDVGVTALALDWVCAPPAASSSSSAATPMQQQQAALDSALHAPDFLAGLVVAGTVEQREAAALVPRSRRSFRTIDGERAAAAATGALDPLRKRFLCVVDAMSRLKVISPSSSSSSSSTTTGAADWVWSISGAIINVLDIEHFGPEPAESETRPTAFERLSASLGIDEAALRASITNAVDRDQAAKVLYRGLVRMVVRKLNAALNPDACVGEAHVSVVSAVAPTLPTAAVAASGEGIDALMRHVLFEDITQVYVTRTHAENIQLQQEGCAVAEVCRAVLDASDNYPTLKTLRAKNGLLSAFDSLEKQQQQQQQQQRDGVQHAPPASVSSTAAAGAATATIDNAAGAAAGAEQADAAPVDSSVFYFKPDAEIADCFDPAKQQKRAQEKVAPLRPARPGTIASQHQQFAAMPFRFVGGAKILSVVHTLPKAHALDKMAESGKPLCVTVSATGVVDFWPIPLRDQIVDKFTVAADLVSCTINVDGDLTIVVRKKYQDGAPPVDCTIKIKMLVERKNSSSELYGVADLSVAAEATEVQQQLNLLARNFLFDSPGVSIDYVAPPAVQKKREQVAAAIAKQQQISSSPAAPSSSSSQAGAGAAAAASSPSPSLSSATSGSKHFSPELQREIRTVFAALPQCATDVINGTVEVPHSFGLRIYKLPRRNDAGDRGLTIAAPAFAKLRAAFTEKTSGLVQEALVLEEQATNGLLSYVALLRSELDSLLQRCLKNPRPAGKNNSDSNATTDATNSYTVPWFSLQITLPSSVGLFDGMAAEQQLSLLPFVSVPSLRAVQPQLLRRYLCVDYPWIAKQYHHILPLAKRRRFRVAYGEYKSKVEKQQQQQQQPGQPPVSVPVPTEVLRGVEESLLVASVGFRMGAVHALIDGPSLVKLEAVAATSREHGLTLVQALLRWRLSFALMTQRSTFVEQARATDRVEGSRVKQARQDALIQVRVLAERTAQLIAEETSSRRDINDSMLVAWVALCAEARMEAEQRTERLLARKMMIEQRDDQRLGQTTKRYAMDALARRIRDRIAANGERLDEMVLRCVVQNEGSRQRQGKMEAVHRNLLNMQVRELEDKTMLELQVRAKTERILGVRERVSTKIEEKKKTSYQKHEAERLAREQLTQQLEARQERAREEAMFTDIERKIAKNIEQELVERQRQQRDAVRQAHLEERQKHRAALQMNAKLQFRKAVEYEIHQEDKIHEQESKRERHNRLLWDAHEKERAAFAAAKEAEKRSERAMTQGLLRAQKLLATPHVFVRGQDGKAHLVDTNSSQSRRRGGVAGGHPSTARSASSVQLDGFQMASGRRTARSLLPEEVWSNVIESMSAVSTGHHFHVNNSSNNNTTTASASGSARAASNNYNNNFAAGQQVSAARSGGAGSLSRARTPPASGGTRGGASSSNANNSGLREHRSVPRSVIALQN